MSNFISLINVDEFCENLKEVTTSKILGKKGKFHPEGLFSEQIFGPIRNYTCQCGIYHGKSKSGGTCDICGVDVVDARERRRRIAKIKLPMTVVNPVLYEIIYKASDRAFREMLDKLSTNKNTTIVLDNGKLRYSEEGEKLTGKTIFEKINGIRDIVAFMAKKKSETVREWNYISKNLDKLLMNNIIIIPPDMRPASKHPGKDTTTIMDAVNEIYRSILNRNEMIRSTLYDVGQNKDIYYKYLIDLQKNVDELFSHIFSRFGDKEGLIRGNILGKRIDFCGRAVIVPDPTLSIDECKIPYLMILEMYKLVISKELVKRGKYKLIHDAIEAVDVCILHESPMLYKIANEIIKDQYCILNRQPSLHRLSTLGFKVQMTHEKSIRIHPLACTPFNADFDGDQMAVYIPVSEETNEEIRTKFLITENFDQPADGSLSTPPSQDIILGIYILTNNMIKSLSKKTKIKNKVLTQGRAIFNSCLPDDFPIIDDIIDKPKLMNILNSIKLRYDKSIVKDVLDKIKQIGFKYSTRFGCTLSLDDLMISSGQEIKEEIYKQDTVEKQLDEMNKKEINEKVRSEFKYSFLIDSGARGNWDQVKQISLSRGFISNFAGEILPTPEENSLLDGLTQKGCFLSTVGSRKGLLDVALNTGVSGYLNRKMIFACANLTSGDIEDCGTGDLLLVNVDNETIAKSLIYRTVQHVPDPEKDFSTSGVDIDITYKNYKEFVGEIVGVYSPIFCKSDQICRHCYGKLLDTLHSKYIGIIAAQTLSECNTQLVLRTFHTSGVAQIGTSGATDMKQKDIINSLHLVSECLHQSKDWDMSCDTLVRKLFDIYITTKFIHLVHFECVVSQMMWHGDTKWRLHPKRDEIDYDYKSIQTVPSLESWVHGFAFSRPKQHVIRGLLNEGKYDGIIDKILFSDV